MITVLANGCFDVFHVGHLLHLQAARQLGDRLIVALTVDEAVNKGPGRPIHAWGQRAALLRALRCVDEVVPSTSSYEAIRAIRPQIFVKGIDYLGSWLLELNREACREVGAVLHVTETPKFSSGDIIRKLVSAR